MGGREGRRKEGVKKGLNLHWNYILSPYKFNKLQTNSFEINSVFSGRRSKCRRLLKMGMGEQWAESGSARECKLKSYQSRNDFRYNLQHNHMSNG